MVGDVEPLVLRSQLPHGAYIVATVLRTRRGPCQALDDEPLMGQYPPGLDVVGDVWEARGEVLVVEHEANRQRAGYRPGRLDCVVAPPDV